MAESQKVAGGEFETRRQTAFFGVCLTFGLGWLPLCWEGVGICRDQESTGARQRSPLGKPEGVWRATGQASMGRDGLRSARTHMHACAALCLQLGLGLSFVVVADVVQDCQRLIMKGVAQYRDDTSGC